jgi:predicted MFS family arabinose efflux permease
MLTVVGVGSAVALSLFGDMAVYVILPVEYAELGLSAIQVGVLLSANRWIRLVTNRLAERLLRFHGSAVFFPLALLLGSGLTVGYAVASGFVLLLMLRLIWGLCWSFIRQTGVMTTISVADSGRGGRNMGIYVALLQLGFVAGSFVAGLLFDAFGYRSTFLLAAAMSLAAVPTAIVGTRHSHRMSRGDEERDPSQQYRSHVRTPLLLFRGFVVSLVGAGLIMSTLGYLLKSRFGDSVSIGTLVVGVTTINGVMLAAQYVIGGAGSPLFGIVIDRVGVIATQLISLAVSGVALVAAGLLAGTALLIPLVVVFFVGGAVSRLAVESQAAMGGPRSYSNLATATDLGSAVGPLLGWLGIELAQSDFVYWAGGAFYLAAALSTALWRKR